MIIVRTPNRISLFGSSTDYKNWWEVYGGISINFAIDKYSWISLKELPAFFDYKSKVTYSEVENVTSHNEIRHNVIREALKYMKIPEGIDLVHQSDLFSKCGLGSSSTFAVGLMHALSVYKGEFWSKQKLAAETSYLEQSVLKENIGFQDTLAAAHGGLNKFDYHTNGDITNLPIFLSRDFLNYFEKCCMLFFTGIHRSAHQITSTYVPSLIEKQCQQFRMIDIAKEAHTRLLEGNIRRIGELLNLTWEEKQKISKNISNELIDHSYNISKKYAWGFKLLGAGGGGSILILADPSQHDTIRQELKLTEIPFRIDWNGSKVLYVNQNGLSRT